MAMTTGNTDLLTRGEVWSGELKEILRDEMMAQKYVRMLEGFPDGDTFYIPSIGQAQVDDYAEDTEINYRPLDTGQFTFSVDKYLSSATYITKKAEQDTFYSEQLISRFVPEQERAIMAHFETTTLAAAESGQSAVPVVRCVVRGIRANDPAASVSAVERQARGHISPLQASELPAKS